MFDDLIAEAAKPTLERIREDGRKLPRALQPVLIPVDGASASVAGWALENRLFMHGLTAGKVWEGACVTSSHKFKSTLGCDLREYIVLRRLDVAKKLLRETELDVSDIAEALGWEYSAFFMNFRKRVKQNPTAYRMPFTAGGIEEAARKARLDGDLGIARAKYLEVNLALHKEMRHDGARTYYDAAVEQNDAGNVDLCYDLLQSVKTMGKLTGGVSAEVITDSRTTGLHSDPDEEFIGRLDGKEDQRLFRSSIGASLREDMCYRSLGLVPRDHVFFQHCTDDSYRTVWAAIDRARYVFKPDALRAWFVSELAPDPQDRQAPPTEGRFIKGRVKIDELRSGDQEERLRYCEFAVEDAESLDDPLLVAEARLSRGNALRVLVRHIDAWEDFEATKDAGRLTRWLAARHANMLGLYEYDRDNYTSALTSFRLAESVYAHLDPHREGIQLAEQGTTFYYMASFDDSVNSGYTALRLLDPRRDPLTVNAYIPINLSRAFTEMGKIDRAEKTIARCKYEQKTHPVVAAAEAVAWAHIHAKQKRYQVALDHFKEAAIKFELLGRHLDTALMQISSMEMHIHLFQRPQALEHLTAAVVFFERTGCTRQALALVTRLKEIIQDEDARGISKIVRNLIEQCGRLPVVN